MKSKLNQTINKNHIIYRTTSIPFSEIDQEIVMLNVKNGEYYGLNEIASDIWNKLVDNPSLSDLITWLMDNYSVDYDTCYTEVSSLLNLMKEKGLITIKSERNENME